VLKDLGCRCWLRGSWSSAAAHPAYAGFVVAAFFHPSEAFPALWFHFNYNKSKSNPQPHNPRTPKTTYPSPGSRDANCRPTAHAMTKLTRRWTENHTKSSWATTAWFTRPWRRFRSSSAASSNPPRVSKEKGRKTTRGGCLSRTARYDASIQRQPAHQPHQAQTLLPLGRMKAQAGKYQRRRCRVPAHPPNPETLSQADGPRTQAREPVREFHGQPQSK
jgi:hypothetical protein